MNNRGQNDPTMSRATDGDPEKNLLDLLADLIDLPPEGRRQRLVELNLTAADRQQVEKWLDAPDDASPFLATVMAPPDSAAWTDSPVPRLAGYEIQERLGEGGMGTVWKAVQLSTKRLVALKLMSAAAFGSEKGRLRFEREVEVTAALDHPNIARVFDSGISDGIVFYAMQLIEGQHLDEFVTTQKLSRPEVLRLMEVVCRAVQHAHQNGVIHRDLKPANILVDAQGQPHVLDFGLAKALAGDKKLSLDGDVAGTPVFMSPEQAAGHLGKLDTRSDVYTLGVILFHLLSGQFPHDTSGTSFEVMRRISEQEPKRLKAIEPRADVELEALLIKTLEKDPQRRYASAGELADDLKRYLNHEALVARPPTLPYLLKKKLRRHRMPLALASVVIVLLLGVAVYAYLRIVRERDTAVAARIEKEQQRREADAARLEAEIHRRRAQLTLDQLRRTAPAFYDRAVALMEEKKFEEALVNVEYAATLAPDEIKYRLLRANLFQSLFHFKEAHDGYRAVLATQPDDAAASENLRLCEKMLGEESREGKVNPITLAQLQAAMQRQGRYVEALVLLQRVDTNALTRQTNLAQYREMLARAGITAELTYREELLNFYAKDDPRTDWSGLRGIPIEWAYFARTGIEDLSPLSGMPLKRLHIANSAVSDLRPLKGMQLVSLECPKTKVNDITVLKGMPLLRLNIESTEVSDISPLAGAPLVNLALGPRVKDLSPLRGMKLQRLYAYNAWIESVDVIEGMPLTDLDLGNTKIHEISVLRGMKLTKLNLRNCPVQDISVLNGMPLASLNIDRTRVTNLAPLRGLPLEHLGLDGLPIDDISVLKGMALTWLSMSQTDVSDLTPLERMPLKRLALAECKNIHDLRPLLECRQLEWLSIPRACPDVERLRSMTSLKSLSYDYDAEAVGKPTEQPVEDFWKHYDSAGPSKNNVIQTDPR